MIAEFDAGDTEATLQALAAAILNYREAVFQLTRAIKLGPGEYFFEASASGGRYSDKVKVARFSDGRLVSLERASRDALDGKAA